VQDRNDAQFLLPSNTPCALGDARALCKEEAALAPRQSQHRVLSGTPGSAENRSCHRWQTPAGTQFLWRI